MIVRKRLRIKQEIYVWKWQCQTLGILLAYPPFRDGPWPYRGLPTGLLQKNICHIRLSYSFLIHIYCGRSLLEPVRWRLFQRRRQQVKNGVERKHHDWLTKLVYFSQPITETLTHALPTFPAFSCWNRNSSFAPTPDWLVTPLTIALISSISTHLYST